MPCLLKLIRIIVFITLLLLLLLWSLLDSVIICFVKPHQGTRSSTTGRGLSWGLCTDLGKSLWLFHDEISGEPHVHSMDFLMFFFKCPWISETSPWGLCWMCCYNTEPVCTHWISHGRNSCQEISTAWWPMNFLGAFPRTTTPQCWLVVPCTASFGCVRGITCSVAWGAPSVAVPSPEASMAQPPLCWRRCRKRHGWGSTCSSPMRWQMPSLGQLLDPMDLDLVDGWLRLVWELGSWPVLCWEDLSALVWWVLRWMRRYWRKAGQRMWRHESLQFAQSLKSLWYQIYPMKRFNIGFLHVGGHSCKYLILLDTRVIGFSQFLLGKS